MTILQSIFEISAASKKQFVVPELLEIVFVGRSNVGKSSLLNTLCNRKQLAKVSNTPGKTQLINFFRILLSGTPGKSTGAEPSRAAGSVTATDTLRFVDLPGYGFAKVSHDRQNTWAKLINTYFESERPIGLVVVLIDSRLPLQENDAAIVHLLTSKQLPVQVVMTKIDKLTQSEKVMQKRSLTAALSTLGVNRELLQVSSKTGLGKRELLSAILDAVHES